MAYETVETLLSTREIVVFMFTFVGTVLALMALEKRNPMKYAIYKPWVKKRNQEIRKQKKPKRTA